MTTSNASMARKASAVGVWGEGAFALLRKIGLKAMSGQEIIHPQNIGIASGTGTLFSKDKYPELMIPAKARAIAKMLKATE